MSKYSLSWILEKKDDGKKTDFLFFWGHRPKKDGSISKTCFSQWWVGEFMEDDFVYKSAEHYMMAGKARLFDDPESLERILKASTPAEAKKLGRKVKNWDELKWKEKRYELVVQGNMLKFGQNPALKAFLLSTGDKTIVEASPYDTIWGIGMLSTDERAHRPAFWAGLNLLGFALMEVRDRLRAE